ncbi:CopG family transcriptional regulator [Nonomuraea muscovyensis]|uniref:ribbon-helix-helix domain-containing protein n=1 Tax=Nonomuraea muscovyensis TaxID=1124761 RepID=UPI0033C8DC7B
MPEVSLYLPEDIKHRVAEAARWHGMTEDDYMREAITRVVSEELIGDRPRPTLPLFDLGGEPLTAERIDEILAEGYGKDGLA